SDVYSSDLHCSRTRSGNLRPAFGCASTILRLFFDSQSNNSRTTVEELPKMSRSCPEQISKKCRRNLEHQSKPTRRNIEHPPNQFRAEPKKYLAYEKLFILRVK